MVDFALRRVDIFLVHALGARVEHTSAEAHHLAAHAYPRKDHTSGVAVDEIAAVVAVADACGKNELVLIALCAGCVGKGVAVVGVVAELEFLYDVVAYASGAEILHAYGHAIGCVAQLVFEIAGSPFVHDEHALALALLLLLLVAQLALMDLDVIFVGKPPQGLGVGHLLMLHDEV